MQPEARLHGCEQSKNFWWHLASGKFCRRLMVWSDEAAPMA
jgi:hypothetical protein